MPTPPTTILLRYGELALKGGNRNFFEKRLAENIEAATAHIAKVKVSRQRGRMTAVLKDNLDRIERVAQRIAEVPGLSSLSLCIPCEQDPDAISALINEKLLERFEFTEASAPSTTFRVETKRADKSFPMSSMELDHYVSKRIPESIWDKIQVQLKRPELVIGIDIRPGHAYIYFGRIEGIGGLPVGSQGRAMCLLSGGIDSPVAAYFAMKRGCRVDFVSFLSPPYIGEPTRLKLEKLVRKVGRFQPKNRLHLVPFTEIQEAIRDDAPEGYRTILYRRMMQRIATKIAKRSRGKAILTGESIGPVASQTLSNIACIEEASSLPVLRPLIGLDKLETILVARQIGTFDISNLPEPDCCTVFMPRGPVIHGQLEYCHSAEAGLDMKGLVDRALNGIEVMDIEAHG
jgi:tRNA uracil 4-sulfurtransferase